VVPVLLAASIPLWFVISRFSILLVSIYRDSGTITILKCDAWFDVCYYSLILMVNVEFPVSTRLLSLWRPARHRGAGLSSDSNQAIMERIAWERDARALSPAKDGRRGFSFTAPISEDARVSSRQARDVARLHFPSYVAYARTVPCRSVGLCCTHPVRLVAPPCHIASCVCFPTTNPRRALSTFMETASAYGGRGPRGRRPKRGSDSRPLISPA